MTQDERLARALGDASEVVFLCSGNMVRSAFAELYARHLRLPVPVRSAATVYRNPRIWPPAAGALHARGVPEAWTRRFRPRHVSDVAGELDERALALGMTRRHLGALAPFPALARRAFLLSELRGVEHEIPDPVDEGADLDAVLAEVAAGVEALADRLREARAEERG